LIILPIIFCLAAISYLIFVINQYSRQKTKFNLEIEELEEQLNLFKTENTRELKNRADFENEIARYISLKNIIEDINKDLNLDSIAGHLAEFAFSLIGNNRGACLLYLIDGQTHRPFLFKVKKEERNLVVKAKEGDIFDSWVLRHTSPLIVEDIKKDFRFDLERLKSQDMRHISSLVSAPFISEHKFLGLLRLDSPEDSSYSQDDLRFLVTICDIAAVALENGQLFQKTQDLAIHDGLTLLFTKAHFMELLKTEYKRCAPQNKAFSLLMLDIDYFKDYNDQFGHTAGDIVLKHLSAVITGSLKAFNPIICRFGGEEFCILLPLMGYQEALDAAEALRLRIEKTKIILRRQETKITVSIGVATLSDNISGEDDLIFKADKAMYEAKQKGRNRVCGI